jgi:murein DD-endopeptidase MepM/ murein hydrolase activator NlpD
LPAHQRVGSLARVRAAAETDREGATTARRNALRTFLALSLLAGTMGVVPALAGTKEQLDAAKAELGRVQAELDRATARWNDAESRLTTTRGEIVDARIRIGRLMGRVHAIETRLNRRAVIAFTNGPASTIDLLLSSGSFTDFTDRLEFLGSMAQSDGDLILEQEVAQEELRRERDDLLVLEERQASVAEELRTIQEGIDAQFGRISDRVAELTAKYREEIAASKELVILGQTPNPDGSLQVCPVAGPNSFIDTFGWPRPGGRTHQGIDLIAPFGTPIVAAHPGTVSYSSSTLGGLQAYVQGSAGYSFYAHLSSYSSASGTVGAGAVIGYVGSTGDAGSTNHLHFEWHPGGGAAVDPYLMLLAVC